MNPKLIVAVFVTAAVPVYAQAQKPSTAKVTTADVQKVVTLISGDKAKTQTYCDIGKLNEQIEEANEKKDIKKTEELSQQIEKTRSRICRADGWPSGSGSGVRRRKKDRFDVRTARQTVCKVANRIFQQCGEKTGA
jgi:hypothetical protein